MGPMGCPVIIHNKPTTRQSWDFRDRKGFNIGPALNHYRCLHVTDATTKALLYSDSVEFMHDYLTQPQVSESDRIVHALNFLSCAVKDTTASVYHDQLTTISNLRDLFCSWNPQHPPTLPDLTPPPHLARAPPPHPSHPATLPAPPPLRPPPRVLPAPPPLRPPPRVVTPTTTPPPPPAPILDTP